LSTDKKNEEKHMVFKENVSMNDTKRHYDRLIAASKAEQILGKSKIYVNVPALKIINKLRPTKERNQYLINSIDTGYIQTKYSSKDKITARMFTTPGNLNLITLSDEDILNCIVSKYGREGILVELDFKQFEPTIMSKLIGYSFDGDIHTIVSKKLKMTRNDAKILNNAYFYGASEETINQKFYVGGDIKDYLDMMEDFNNAKDKFLEPHLEMYEKNGYIINPYGRKVFPREKRNIFNNMIQSTGSDILIDTIIKLNQENLNVILHRFDSLFFDLKKLNIYLELEEIITIMTENNYNLEVSVLVGKNLNKLKKLN